MGQIKVNTSELREYADSLSKLAGRLDNVQYLLNNTFDRAVLSTKKLANGQKLDTAASRLRKCQSFLNGVADDFSSTEKYLASFNPTDFDLNDVNANTCSVVPAVKSQDKDKKKTKSYIEFGSESASASLDLKYKNSSSKEYWDKDYKSKASLRIKGKASFEVNGAKIGISADNGWASGSAEGKVLNVKAEGSAEAGLYTIEVDENGKKRKVFSPQVKAEVKASVSLFEGSAKGEIGNEYIGADGKLDVTLLSAEAKAKLKVSKDEAILTLGSEANIFKAGGTAGLSILGEKDVVKVGGSIKVGVGAQANFNLKNGKVKCDIGATLGVGVEVSFEVDIKGTVNATCKAAKSAWGGIKSGYKAAKNAFKGALKWLH